MLKKYKNEIFEIIKTSKFGVENFKLIEEDQVATIQYKDSPYHFIVRTHADSYNLFDYIY